jgi:DNA-binding MarR family transcriptional regulator
VPADAQRLDAQLCFALHAATRAVIQAYEPLLSELDLTYTQYLVFLVLWEEDGASVSRIGERLYLDSGTLTPLLKRLEGKGLVRRKRSESDERCVEIWLTPEGKALKRRARHIPEKLLCRFDMSVGDVGRLRGDIVALLRTLQTPTPEEKTK